jgi:hypothetical protein
MSPAGDKAGSALTVVFLADIAVSCVLARLPWTGPFILRSVRRCSKANGYACSSTDWS